jgi:hypothetical protein
MDADGPLLRATLELDVASHAPRGSLTAADGERRTFSGWTELASVIEGWRAAGRGEDDQAGGTDVGPG